MRLSVIIVNYHVSRFCEQTVRSVLASTVAEETEVFVVDNASQDDSLEYLQRQFPSSQYERVHIIAPNRNLGFGRANNLAASQATGDYILFLNPDTLLGEETLEEMLKFADYHEYVGAVGVSMTNDDGTFAPESRRGLPTPWTAFCKLSGLNALFPKSRLFGRYYMAYLSAKEPHATEVVSGACFLVRNDRRGEWFDPDFFMYGEDVDLSYRLMKEGKTNYYFPTPFIHYKGESTNKTSFRYAHVFYGAMLIFLRKHFPRYAFWLSPVIGSAILLTAAKNWLRTWWTDLSDYLRPQQAMPQPQHYLYIGKHAIALQQCAPKYGVSLRVVEADEDSYHDAVSGEDFSRYDFVIFDLQDFSRKAIIQHLQERAGQTRLALYDSQRGVLITHGRQINIGL